MVFVLALFISSASTQAQSVEPALPPPPEQLASKCADLTAAAKSGADTIAARYKGAIEERMRAYQQEAATIQGEAPQPEPVEGVLNMDITVEMKDQEFFIDVPSVTMRDQKMSMDLPQVTMKETRWSFDVPKITMKTQCTKGPDEYVCDHYRDSLGIEWPYNCHSRPGKDICLDLPFHENDRKEWIFSSPEITWGTTEWVMGVPEFRMETQRLVMGIPEIRVDNVQVGIQNAKDKAEDLKARASRDTEVIVRSMKEEAAANAAIAITETFACHEKTIVDARTDALAKFDSNIALLRGLQEEARSKGADSFVNNFQESLDRLSANREEATKKFEEALSKLRQARDTAVHKLIPESMPELTS